MVLTGRASTVLFRFERFVTEAHQEVFEPPFPKLFFIAVWSFRDAICESNQKIACLQVKGLLLELNAGKQTHWKSFARESRHVTSTYQHRCQMSGVAVNQLGGFLGIKAEEERGVLFRRTAGVKMIVQNRQNI